MGDIALKGQRTAVEVPINTLLLGSGKHIIDLKIYPNLNQSTLNENSYGEITLHYFDTDNYDREIELFVRETPNGDHNNLNGLPYYQLKAEINLELPFSIEGWTNSVNLKDEMENGKDLKREIQNSYDDIITIIKNRDVQAFSKLIKEREELLGVAFYSTAQEKKDNLNEFLEIIQNPDYELQPYPEKAELHFFAYGKLVTLSSPIRESVIELINKKTEKIISLDFYFHRKNKGGKLEVIL